MEKRGWQDDLDDGNGVTENQKLGGKSSWTAERKKPCRCNQELLMRGQNNTGNATTMKSKQTDDLNSLKGKNDGSS